MAAEHQRSISRWSTATRSTGLSQQTIPLVNVRRKLFRTANPNQKLFQQRQTQTKQDIEQLFRLYYSNDLQFDTFQRQIVTGKRIPTTPSTSTNNSTHQFSDPKLCVSREQLTPRENIPHNSKSATPIRPQKQRNTPMKAEIIDLTPRQTHPTVSQPVPESSVNDFCEPSLVKSVTFLDGGLTDSFDEMKSIGKPFQTRRPTSSKSSIYSGTIDAPHPSFLVDRSTNEINPRISSHKSSSTTTSVTLSRLPSRTNTHIRTTTVSNRQRIQSGTTVSTDLPSKPLSISTRSPVTNSPLSFQSEATAEESTSPTSKRVVSIPSRCSRYVLVSFPETPLRYTAPTYVERLLLPERFPTLFQNIVRSYGSRLTQRSDDDQRKDRIRTAKSSSLRREYV